MTLHQLNPFAVLKVATLALLAILLFSLGSASHPTSLLAYVSFSAIMALQALEMLAPVFSEEAKDPAKRTLALRISILVQMFVAGVLVAATDGSGSIYELVYLLPIVSAATKLDGRDVIYVVAGSTVAMMGFIVTGEQLSSSITRVKEFQDAVAAIVYFSMTGFLVHVFVKGERTQRERYRTLAATLVDRNEQLRRAQAQLTERLDQVTKMEERLQQVSRMAVLGEMAGQVAHEVRNPLGIIKGAVEMLAMRKGDSGTERHIAVILEETARLNKAVEGVLRLGAPLEVKRERVWLADLLEGVVQVSKAWSLRPGSSITLPTSKTPLAIYGDADLLHQAFANLVRNAFQSMPEGGVVNIEVDVAEDNAALTITIVDHGVGLSPEELTRLGEPFFTKSRGGVGLGFSLARRIVLEHGGAITAASVVNKGTAVSVRLPVFQVRQDLCSVSYQDSFFEGPVSR